RPRDENAAPGRRTAARGIPCGVDAIVEWRTGIAIRRDHRLVVEMVGAARKREEGRLRPGAAAIGGTRDGHRRPVDPGAVPEIDADVSVETIALVGPGERRVGAEVDAIGALGR